MPRAPKSIEQNTQPQKLLVVENIIPEAQFELEGPVDTAIEKLSEWLQLYGTDLRLVWRVNPMTKTYTLQLVKHRLETAEEASRRHIDDENIKIQKMAQYLRLKQELENGK